MKYAYITGCAILLLFWLIIFWWRKDLRREMIWASLWGMPFGFIDFFLVPTYWHPGSLFGLMEKYGVGLESFIFFSAMAGLVSVAYQFLRSKKTRKLSRRARHPRFWLLLVFLLVYVALFILFPTKAIYNLMIAGALGAIITIYKRPDLREQIIASAFIFSLFYFLIFVLVNSIFSGLVAQAYNLGNTWGILVWGVPLEEIVATFFAGAFWSTLYEYTMV